MYVAIEKGYFSNEGIDLSLVTGFGADKTMTAVLSGTADIGFMGSEASIYTYNEGANDYVVNFAQLTQRAGNFLVAREDIKDFKWEDLKGKKVAVTTNSEAVRQLQDLNKTYNPPIELIYTDKGFTEGANLVVTGRADATPQYEVSITDAVKTLGLPIKAVGPVISSVPTYFALKKDDDHQKLADTIDKTLKDMKADGTLKKLSEQFLGKDYTVPQQ